LEVSLRLINHSTRNMTLTDDGQLFCQHGIKMFSEPEDA
jgi:DNA-binding transcriptional LysR family regulator